MWCFGHQGIDARVVHGRSVGGRGGRGKEEGGFLRRGDMSPFNAGIFLKGLDNQHAMRPIAPLPRPGRVAEQQTASRKPLRRLESHPQHELGQRQRVALGPWSVRGRAARGAWRFRRHAGSHHRNLGDSKTPIPIKHHSNGSLAPQE